VDIEAGAKIYDYAVGIGWDPMTYAVAIQKLISREQSRGCVSSIREVGEL
jgi:hypothetical protein